MLNMQVYEAQTSDKLCCANIVAGNHNIQYFTDEPVREAGYITPEHFVTLWKHQESKQPQFKPNVDIQASIYDSKTEHMVPYSEAATLNSVLYDKHLHIMHYVACPIKALRLLKKNTSNP